MSMTRGNIAWLFFIVANKESLGRPGVYAEVASFPCLESGHVFSREHFNYRNSIKGNKMRWSNGKREIVSSSCVREKRARIEIAGSIYVTTLTSAPGFP